MPAQVRLLHRVFGVGDRPQHAVGETEKSPTVRLEADRWICHPSRWAHATRPGPIEMRRERTRASAPSTMPITPNTSAAAPPTTPLPLPGPPLATANTSTPLMRPTSEVTKVAMTPSGPDAAPKDLAGRASASPPPTTPASANTTTEVAHSRRGVTP